MAGLDARFVIDLSLQQVFRDKDTGLPLRSGVITFYEDCNRTTPKDVYTLSGGPGAYEYTNIGNVVTLNSAGYFTDTIYYFPYEGDNETSTGVIELYYITVESSTAVTQQAREAIPNLVAGGTEDGSEIDNFIPNGQFRANLLTDEDGNITEDETCVAFGPWYFVRGAGSSAVDNVTFNELGIVDNPEKSPRYECVIQNVSGTDSKKDLRIRFKDVNKFASLTDTFTFKFSGRSKGASSVPVELFVVRNFGTGGSPSSVPDTSISTTINLTTSYDDVAVSFIFGDNDGLVLGSNNDDYVELAIRFPITDAFTAAITDAVLVVGTDATVIYPYITDEQDSAVYLGGSLPYPTPTGLDKYLPVYLGDCGLEFDDSVVGEIHTLGYDKGNVGVAKLICDGTSYDTSDKHNGVPLSRLQNKLLRDTGGSIPIWGTGKDNATAWSTSTNDSYGYFYNNTNGVTTASADVDTTFTIDLVHKGADYDAIAYRSDSSTFITELVTYGAANSSPGAGTSGFTVSQTQVGRTHLRALTSVTVVDAAALTVAALDPALYYLWSNTTTDYYVWYVVDGDGDDPAPGGIGIEIQLLGTDSIEDVLIKTRIAINGYEETSVLYVAGASVVAGTSWKLSTTAYDYYIWYTVDGIGVDPTSSTVGIEVAITSSDTIAQVASKTEVAFNSARFGVPDLRGQFLRGVDDGAGVDPDSATRYIVDQVGADNNGDVVGSCQDSANLSHNHGITEKVLLRLAIEAAPGSAKYAQEGRVLDPGSVKESRPVNKYVYYAIHI